MAEMSPDNRRRLVQDTIDKRFGKIKPLTDEEKVMLKAKEVVKNVAKQVEVVLKCLPNSAAYNEQATAQFMADMFRPAFNQMSKEELLHLCVILHVSPMMEYVTEQVNMGLIGLDKDKPI